MLTDDMIKHIGTKPKNIFPAGCIFYQEEAIVSLTLILLKDILRLEE